MRSIENVAGWVFDPTETQDRKYSCNTLKYEPKSIIPTYFKTENVGDGAMVVGSYSYKDIFNKTD